MSVPLSAKVKSFNASPSPYSRPTSAIGYSATIMNEGRVERVVSNSAMLSSGFKKTNPAELDGTLRDIKRRYEDEARNVQQNYEVDYQNYAGLVRSVEELEILLEEERRRSMDFENRYNAVVLDLEKERRLRMDFEHECTVLKEELRRAEAIISDYELRLSRFNQDINHSDSENKTLRSEIHRLTDMFNIKVRDLEEKYLLQVRDLTSECERQRNQLEHQRIDAENRLRDLDRDWGVKFTRLEERLRDKERLSIELESELRQLNDHIVKIKLEYEEELRRQVILVREEEQRKFNISLRNLETRIKQIEDERDLVTRKNQELVRDLHMKERQLQDLRLQFDAEIARLKNEIGDLRGQASLLNSNNEKLRTELVARDTAINRLEAEIQNFEREISRVKDLHTQEVNRLINDQNNERRRWEDAERLLQSRIAELERLIRALESENTKLRTDLERLKEQITGNVHRTIFQTFTDYEHTQGRTMNLY